MSRTVPSHLLAARVCPTTPQLFYHGKELRSDLYDSKTLLKMDMHTGFAVKGYDLVRWVVQTHKMPNFLSVVGGWFPHRGKFVSSCSHPTLPQSVEPAYFPPVFLTPEGLREKQPIYNPEFLQRHPEASGGVK